MNVKAWLDIYDDTQYRDGNWNVHIVAKTFRTLLLDIDKLYAVVEAVKIFKEAKWEFIGDEGIRSWEEVLFAITDLEIK